MQHGEDEDNGGFQTVKSRSGKDGVSSHVLAFRNAKRCGSDKMWRVDTHEGYKLWRVDTHDPHSHLRGIYFPPCCGTTETDEKRISREDLPPCGFRSRLSNIFSDVAASGVLHPTTKACAWYNRVSQSPCPFIVKLTMEPAVYHQVYLKHYGIAINESAESAQRFQDDYYGDRVLMVYQTAQVGNAVPAGNAGSRMLRANDEDVLKTGSVVQHDPFWRS